MNCLEKRVPSNLIEDSSEIRRHSFDDMNVVLCYSHIERDWNSQFSANRRVDSCHSCNPAILSGRSAAIAISVVRTCTGGHREPSCPFDAKFSICGLRIGVPAGGHDCGNAAAIWSGRCSAVLADVADQNESGSLSGFLVIDHAASDYVYRSNHHPILHQLSGSRRNSGKIPQVDCVDSGYGAAARRITQSGDVHCCVDGDQFWSASVADSLFGPIVGCLGGPQEVFDQSARRRHASGRTGTDVFLPRKC